MVHSTRAALHSQPFNLLAADHCRPACHPVSNAVALSLGSPAVLAISRRQTGGFASPRFGGVALGLCGGLCTRSLFVTRRLAHKSDARAPTRPVGQRRMVMSAQSLI